MEALHSVLINQTRHQWPCTGGFCSLEVSVSLLSLSCVLLRLPPVSLLCVAPLCVCVCVCVCVFLLCRCVCVCVCVCVRPCFKQECASALVHTETHPHTHTDNDHGT